MAKPEWMPVKPCLPDCKQRDGYCPPRARFGCPEYKEYEAAVEQSLKLLDYLIAFQGTGAGDDPRYKDYLPKSVLKQMKSQLEKEI